MAEWETIELQGAPTLGGTMLRAEVAPDLFGLWTAHLTVGASPEPDRSFATN
jgi:hypothetical protein